MTREYFQVPVAEVIRETDEACSLVLDVPASLVSEFSHRPGQFVTVRVPSERCGSVARCYSLSSSPVLGERPAITVKRTEGGYASNWICDRVRAGTVLDLLPPAGMFSPRALDGDFLLFAAGSGITPVMSILKSALHAGRGRVVLVYANRDERTVIFGAALRRLCADSGGRLVVVHWLDSLLGVPSAAAIAALARPYASAEAYICGPDPYLALVREALGQLRVPGSRVHVERFLSLCAQDNMTVAVPTTPANYFHLLRWQALSGRPKPLIVFTPKSMLRLKAATSAVAEFTHGSFLPVFGDPRPADPAGVRTVVLCAGKIYYDLAEKRAAEGRDDIALIRVERLYPLPLGEILTELDRYPAEAEIAWVQEEPANMGAWPIMALWLPGLLERKIRVVSPPASSAPALGSSVAHAADHKAVIERALNRG